MSVFCRGSSVSSRPSSTLSLQHTLPDLAIIPINGPISQTSTHLVITKPSQREPNAASDPAHRAPAEGGGGGIKPP